MDWQIDGNFQKNFFNICYQAVNDNSVFSTFRSNTDFTEILEHVSKDHGQKYLDHTIKQTPQLLKYFDKFQENDIIGSPKRYVYGEFIFSPTTLRYIKVLSDLITIFNFDFINLDICEIGCGYGGQCNILHLYRGFKSYTLIDAVEPSLLQKKYLLNSSNINNLYFENYLQKYDIVISNYSFDELSKETQNKYKTIIDCSKKGYFTVINNIDEFLPQNSLKISQNNFYDLSNHNVIYFTKEV